jgi:hypothetical protein
MFASLRIDIAGPGMAPIGLERLLGKIPAKPVVLGRFQPGVDKRRIIAFGNPVKCRGL